MECFLGNSKNGKESMEMQWNPPHYYISVEREAFLLMIHTIISYLLEYINIIYII